MLEREPQENFDSGLRSVPFNKEEEPADAFLYRLPEEIKAREEKELEAREREFYRMFPDIMGARVMSDLEARISSLRAKLRDSQSNWDRTWKILNPVTHIKTKIEEHGILKGAIPAIGYGVVTPVLVGVPNLAREILIDFFQTSKYRKELADIDPVNESVTEEVFRFYQKLFTPLSKVYLGGEDVPLITLKEVAEELVSLKGLIKTKEEDTKFKVNSTLSPV